jgi:hypothetical protein
MAKVTMPLMSAEARGKVGGIVYNTWRGKSTVKVKKAPAQPRTTRQLLIRAYATTCARAWKNLTSVVRDGWTAYANAHPDTDWTNSPKRLTGLNYYLRCATRCLDMLLSVPTTAPTVDAPANVSALVATGGAGQISCAFTPYGGTATQIDVWVQGPKSAGALGSLVKARHKAYGPGETSPLVITALPPGLYAVFARGILETNGLASLFVETTATVT